MNPVAIVFTDGNNLRIEFSGMLFLIATLRIIWSNTSNFIDSLSSNANNRGFLYPLIGDLNRDCRWC